jgi:hypothetical protein
MPDEDLVRLESSIKSQIGRLKKVSASGPNEVDLCYVQREIEIRQKRAVFNARWRAERGAENY